MVRAVMGIAASALLMFACRVPDTTNESAVDAAPAPPPSASVARAPSFAGDAGGGFGIATSGPSHVSMMVRSEQVDGGVEAAALRPLFGKVSGCYRRSARYTANDAVRVTMRGVVNPNGTVTAKTAVAVGKLVDKGRGEQG